MGGSTINSVELRPCWHWFKGPLVVSAVTWMCLLAAAGVGFGHPWKYHAMMALIQVDLGEWMSWPRVEQSKIFWSRWKVVDSWMWGDMDVCSGIMLFAVVVWRGTCQRLFCCLATIVRWFPIVLNPTTMLCEQDSASGISYGKEVVYCTWECMCRLGHVR